MQRLFQHGEEGSDFVDITPEERQQQLEQLEKRLDVFEAEIVEQERAVRIQQQQKPSAVKRCCSYRCFSTADIKADIPGRFQRSVYFMHYLWIFNSLTLIMNWISMLLYNGLAINDKSPHFLMTTLFVLFGIPGGYHGWYRRYFIAIANQSQTKFMIFNVNYIVHVLFVLVMSIGFAALNSAGILLMIRQISKAQKGAVEILIIVTAIMWLLDLIASLILLKKCFKVNTLIQYGKLIKKDPNVNVVVVDKQ